MASSGQKIGAGAVAAGLIGLYLVSRASGRALVNTGATGRNYGPSDVPGSLAGLWSTFNSASNDAKLEEYAGQYRTDVIAIAWRESNINPNTQDGSAGEVGIMQIKPATASDFGFSATDLRNVYKNIVAGSMYFHNCLYSMGTIYDAYRAYNRGVTGAKTSPTNGKEYALDVLNRSIAVASWESIHIFGNPA